MAARSLRDVLTPAEFQRAGLEKLTDAELGFLSERLLGAPPPDQPVLAAPALRADSSPEVSPGLPAGEAAFGQEEQLHVQVEKLQQVPTELQSRIEGRFSGWSGRTIFRLANGQVWSQAEPSVFSVNLMSPLVTIRKGRFGTFFLGLEGYGSQVKVKRVK